MSSVLCSMSPSSWSLQPLRRPLLLALLHCRKLHLVPNGSIRVDKPIPDLCTACTCVALAFYLPIAGNDTWVWLLPMVCASNAQLKSLQQGVLNVRRVHIQWLAHGDRRFQHGCLRLVWRPLLGTLGAMGR